ncbi:hypothetical protein BG015_005595 [Linnemannia schmuckeri]|uniref:Myb-like domain-containing protein n=1 Tax=Linnemannia schmuckeri TaxID=64567 RepID=A0A9P5VEY2_9FUNG|nr:hypothetical protein BG015_005595 [Linnemannia schmuckeri]
MPPEARALQIPANLSLPQQHPPTLKSNHAPLHQVPDLSFAPRSGVNTSTVGLNASSTMMPNFMSGSSNRSLLNVPEHQGGPTRRNSYSNRHAKDTLFHKDTHHYPGISKQQQIQLERQKKFQQHAQLQQAHQEFHRQRELYQMQQQQQLLQQRLPTAPAASVSSQPQGASQPSRTPHAQHHHHHHHHHHFHVHPLMANSTNIQQQLSLTIPSSPHSQRAIASIPTSSSSSPSYPGASSSIASHQSSNTSMASSGTASGSPRMSSSNHHHHHHHTSLHQHLPPQRPNQFSEWTNVKEKERARLLSNMARVRETQPPVPSAEAAKENLKRLSQRLHQRRTRARETILYDLHQGVKTVEAQVHKQVDMVLSRLKDAPGSKYAFALTHTFLTQIPQALSNTILPSAISAVADTVAGRTTNSLTTLRGRAGLDEFDEDDEDEDDEDDLDDLDDIEELSYQQQLALLRSHQLQNSGVSQQLSSEFGTIALASSSSSSTSCSGSCSSGSSSATEASATPGIHHHSGDESVSECYGEGTKTSAPVSISREGASEFLSASTHHNYSIAASQVLNAALPSFIPSMVAPIVCVFSYPSPPATKPNTPQQSTPSSPSLLNLTKDNHSAASGTGARSLNKTGTLPSEPEHTVIKQEPVDEDMRLQQEIKINPGIVVVNSNAWTSAEREALFLAATRFRLHGQWSKIRQMMGLHRTDKEIEDEYQRLYGEDEEMQSGDDVDEDLVPIKQESGVEDDGDADDEAEPAVFMRFGGQHRATTPRQQSYSPAAQQQQDHQFTVTSGGSMLLDIRPLLTVPTATTTASSTRPSHRHAHVHGHHARSDPGGHGHGHHRHHDRLLKSFDEKPLRIIKKEVMIDKRFALEDIPLRI